MIRVPALAGALALACTAWGSAADDRLHGVICGHETRGEKRPAWAVSPNGADWGMCQVKYHSAVAFGGFARNRNPGDLFDLAVNRQVARAILADCRRRYPNATPYRMAYCYKEGPYAVPARDRTHKPARFVRGHAYALAIAGQVAALTAIKD